MYVGVVEAGHHQLAPEVENFSVSAYPFADFVRGSDGDDAAAQTRYGGGARLMLVDGPDVGVQQNQAGGGLRARKSHGGQQDRGGRGKARTEHYPIVLAWNLPRHSPRNPARRVDRRLQAVFSCRFLAYNPDKNGK